MNDRALHGGIEAGGTKFICAVGTAPDAITEQITIPTTTPEETLGRVIAFFRQYKLKSIGIASFGPLNLNLHSITYGAMTATAPKEGWQSTPLFQIVTEQLGVSAAIDTDVNGAALGELQYGAGKGLQSLVYMTVGTGVGVGTLMGGRPVRGLSHTEAGHVLIPRLAGDTMASACPYHEHCLEGLTSGAALKQRWGQSPEVLIDVEAWGQEAHYLGCGLANIILASMPERVIIGGGVLGHDGLLEAVRQATIEALGGYVTLPATDYIVAPSLGTRSGITGALLLATGITG